MDIIYNLLQELKNPWAVGFLLFALTAFIVFLLFPKKSRRSVTAASPSPPVPPGPAPTPPTPPGPAPIPTPPPAPKPSWRQKLGAWPWKWILGTPLVLAILGAIWHFWSAISSSAASATTSVSNGVGSVGAVVWLGLGAFVILGVVFYFKGKKGVGVSLLALLALAAIATAWHIGSSAGMPTITWPTDWKNKAQWLTLGNDLMVLKLPIAIALLGVAIPLFFFIGWRRTGRGLRKGIWWLICASTTGFMVYLAVAGYQTAAMIGIGLIVAISVVFRAKGWGLITLIGLSLLVMLVFKHFERKRDRFDHAVEARATTQRYSAKEMRELQKDSQRGIQLFRCSFTPVDGDEWWFDSQCMTLPEVWDFHGGHLSFTIHWSYGQTIFVDLYNSPSGNIAKGTWTWFDNGGIKVLKRGDAILATPVPDPTTGPEVGGSLLMIPHKRWNDSELVLIRFVLRFPQTLKAYQADVQKRL